MADPSPDGADPPPGNPEFVADTRNDWLMSSEKMQPSADSYESFIGVFIDSVAPERLNELMGSRTRRGSERSA